MENLDLIFSITLLTLGVPMTLVGFKIINPFRNDETPEREFKWEKNGGPLFRIGGVLFLVISLYHLFNP